MALSSVDDKVGRVLTQYRESPKLLGMIRAYVDQINDAQEHLCAIPSKFDLDTAVGNQLTIIGRWLGFPRCHNVPSAVPVFGFVCDGVSSPYNLKGFCESAIWFGCPGIASSRVCITDDELYRRFLKVRRYQLLGKNDYTSFQECLELLFPSSGATYSQADRAITVDPNRSLTTLEATFHKVFERVLPRALGSTISVLNV